MEKVGRDGGGRQVGWDVGRVRWEMEGAYGRLLLLYCVEYAANESRRGSLWGDELTCLVIALIRSMA